ncbi:hypothetical protein PBI_INGRID_35 [Arthrobacter phage Ingrid]|nr:hypothetical protein PBI_INGRID_35 [Arthrobacter phage Ingrid]QFG11017.1 hypothetical protein PBI_LORETTA_35 [Arthrobacter phage Loretta]
MGFTFLQGFSIFARGEILVKQFAVFTGVIMKPTLKEIPHE